MTRVITVSFGSRKKNLSTVGYTLINADGTTLQSRTTDGVVELDTGNTGIYGAQASFPDGFAGYILWDTGEASPLYAGSSYNEEPQPGGVGFIQTGVNEEEKKKILARLKKILKILQELAGKDNTEVISAVDKIKQGIVALGEKADNIADKIPKGDSMDQKEMVESIRLLSKAMCLVLESNQFDGLKTEAQSDVDTIIKRFRN